MVMRKSDTSRTTLFFMELVVVIFFFAVCSAICIGVFGNAHQVAKESEHLSKAVLETRSAASCYKASGGDMKRAAKLLNGYVVENDLTVYYDEAWKKTEEYYADGFALYIVEAEKRGEADVFVVNLQTEKTLFTLPVKAGQGGNVYAEK